MNNAYVLELLNLEMAREFFASMLYLELGANLENKQYNGLACWLFNQAEEEREHGIKVMRYLLDRGEMPRGLFPDLNAMADLYKIGLSDADEPVAIFDKVLNFEKRVAESINSIAAEALQVADYATYEFLQWFIKNQVSEINEATKMLTKLQRIGNDKAALTLFDEEILEECEEKATGQDF
jgi:ferritin